jgi:hypothetical protein
MMDYNYEPPKPEAWVIVWRVLLVLIAFGVLTLLVATR